MPGVVGIDVAKSVRGFDTMDADEEAVIHDAQLLEEPGVFLKLLDKLGTKLRSNVDHLTVLDEIKVLKDGSFLLLFPRGGLSSQCRP